MSGPLRIICSLVVWVACLSAACFTLFCPSTQAQGFGTPKKKITLNRKLPPTAHLSGNNFRVEASANGNIQKDVPDDLKTMLEVELQKDDARLSANDRSPDTVITCTVTQYAQPTPTTSTSQQYQLGSKKPQNVTATRYTGLLTVAYQAKDAHSGRTIDSANVTAKYDDEFDQSGSTHKGIGGKITGTFGTIAHGKSEADTPPTAAELKNKLLNDVVKQIASRLVVTDEAVEVLLAQGKLSDYNKLAENARWSDYLEKLETMEPFPSKEDDAYRLYNIGVAYEAMGYTSEDQKAAQKDFQDAAISYGKAADGKPSEKYFVQPQNRIETALVHYKKLQEEPASTSTTTASGSKSSDTPAKSTKAASTHNASASGSASRTSSSGVAKSLTPVSTPKSSGPPMTNEQVIKMVKANVDEANIIDTIRHASTVSFDLSVDGQVNLANNGVKGNILTAMKARARQGKTASQ
jgi:Plant specific mitochondrial import receptor subunit TOM20